MKPAVYMSPTVPRPAQPATQGRVRAVLWSIFWLLVAGVVIGLTWDRAWHATHAFDTFYTPPHLLVYSVAFACAGLVAMVVFAPGLRMWFSPTMHVPLFPFPVPCPLFLLGGGFVTLGLAGLLDDLWHTAFGLDETGWSAPHAMIGWGLLMIVLGFASSFLALQPARKLPWHNTLLLGYFALAFSATPFMGPLIGNHTPDTVAPIRFIPVLAAQPAAQHTLRIYLTWNLNHTNPLFLILSALWAGAALAFIRGLDARARVFLGVTGIWWLLSLISDRGDLQRTAHFLDTLGLPHAPLLQHDANWLPLPVFPAALVLAIVLAAHMPEGWAWVIAGTVFGALVYLIWRESFLPVVLVLLAGPSMLLGARLGQSVCGIVRRPGGSAVFGLLVAGVAIPFLTGAVDLYLRAHTP